MAEKLTRVQKAAQLSILHAVDSANGEARWDWLHDRGHLFAQVKACANRGLLEEIGAYRWSLTPAGRRALEEA